ncbi:MAG TPA: ABC transporter permease [Conexibacter sp.]|nr:ABC transporter permease [Conexibacter sp.]
MSVIRRHRWLQAAILLGPAAVWALAFIVVPTVLAVCMGFWKMRDFRLVKEWNLDNYSTFLNGDIYWRGLLNALENGAMAAALAVALSVPLAHFIRFRVRRHKTLFIGAVVVALWLGYLLRVFGWRVLFGANGVLNTFLIDIGLTEEPLSFLIFSRFAIVLTQTQLAMPFAFIPIYAALERVQPSLLQAAGDLGAPRWRQLVNVELPLIAPALVIGATFSFILAFGDYFATSFVGPPSASQTIGNQVADNFRATINWPMGAALGTVMMLTILLVLSLPALMTRLWRPAARRRGGRPPATDKLDEGAIA